MEANNGVVDEEGDCSVDERKDIQQEDASEPGSISDSFKSETPDEITEGEVVVELKSSAPPSRSSSCSMDDLKSSSNHSRTAAHPGQKYLHDSCTSNLHASAGSFTLTALLFAEEESKRHPPVLDRRMSSGDSSSSKGKEQEVQSSPGKRRSSLNSTMSTMNSTLSSMNFSESSLGDGPRFPSAIPDSSRAMKPSEVKTDRRKLRRRRTPNSRVVVSMGMPFLPESSNESLDSRFADASSSNDRPPLRASRRPSRTQVEESEDTGHGGE